jgi:hypothetical protein
MRFLTVKHYAYTLKYYLNNYFHVMKLLNMVMMRNFEVIAGQTLNYSV